MAKTGKKRPITIFSVMALVVLVLGGGLTIVVSIVRVDNWIRSGESRFRVGEEKAAQLPAGELVVFFESPIILPGDRDAVHLFVLDANGDSLRTEKFEASDAEAYAPRRFLPGPRVFGRPLWRVQIPADGTYTLRVQNDHAEQYPDLDEIVIGKQPQSFSTLVETSQQVKIVGLSLTGALVVVLYVLHGIRLSRRDPEVEPLDDPIEF